MRIPRPGRSGTARARTCRAEFPRAPRARWKTDQDEAINISRLLIQKQGITGQNRRTGDDFRHWLGSGAGALGPGSRIWFTVRSRQEGQSLALSGAPPLNSRRVALPPARITSVPSMPPTALRRSRASLGRGRPDHPRRRARCRLCADFGRSPVACIHCTRMNIVFRGSANIK